MAKKKVIVAAGILAVLGGAAAIAAVGHREGRYHRHGHDGFDLAQGYGDWRGRRGGDDQGDHRGRMRGRDDYGMGGHRGMGDGSMMGGPMGGREGRGWFRRGMSADDFDARTRERFARLDRNSDGVIDTAEATAAITEMGDGRGRGRFRDWMTRRMERSDADRDGKTTRAEVLERVRRDFQRMDLDGDGRITEADLPPVMRGRDVLKGGPGGMGRGTGGGLLGRLMAADTNRDGVITLEEALAEAGRRFELADRNKDGVLDASDSDAMVKEMTDYRVRRFMHMHGARDGRITREQFFAAAKERFADLDVNRDGRIDRDDMRPRRGRAGSGGPAAPDAAPAPERK